MMIAAADALDFALGRLRDATPPAPIERRALPARARGRVTSAAAVL